MLLVAATEAVDEPAKKIEEEIEKKSECECEDCRYEKHKAKMKRKKMERNYD